MVVVRVVPTFRILSIRPTSTSKKRGDARRHARQRASSRANLRRLLWCHNYSDLLPHEHRPGWRFEKQSASRHIVAAREAGESGNAREDRARSGIHSHLRDAVNPEYAV